MKDALFLFVNLEIVVMVLAGFWLLRRAEAYSEAFFELAMDHMCCSKRVYDKYFDEKGRPKKRPKVKKKKGPPAQRAIGPDEH